VVDNRDEYFRIIFVFEDGKNRHTGKPTLFILEGKIGSW